MCATDQWENTISTSPVRVSIAHAYTPLNPLIVVCLQLNSGSSISPFCDEVDDFTRGCTLDHEYISSCNLRSNVDPPPEFQVSVLSSDF